MVKEQISDIVSEPTRQSRGGSNLQARNVILFREGDQAPTINNTEMAYNQGYGDAIFFRKFNPFSSPEDRESLEEETVGGSLSPKPPFNNDRPNRITYCYPSNKEDGIPGQVNIVTQKNISYLTYDYGYFCGYYDGITSIKTIRSGSPFLKDIIRFNFGNEDEEYSVFRRYATDVLNFGSGSLDFLIQYSPQDTYQRYSSGKPSEAYPTKKVNVTLRQRV